MARKNQLIPETQQEIIEEKDRIAGVLASMLEHTDVALLGDLSDDELRRVASLMFTHVGVYASQVRAERTKQQLQDIEDDPVVEGELRYDCAGMCWGIWDADTDKQVGKIHPEMDIEFFEDGKWIPATIKMMIMNDWYMEAGEKYFPKTGGNIPMFDGWRVRTRRTEC